MYLNIYKFVINLFIILTGLVCGIILGYLFIKNNTKYHGPNSNKIRKKVHLYKNKYYKYTPIICVCPI